jgi:4'-phosphopantetheinyl transferase EntD
VHVLPPSARFEALTLDEATHTPIAPEEAALASPRAVEKRRRELHAGRVAAHRALARAGAARAEAPILKGPRGEPLWPAGWVGAITHSDRLAAALVAPRAVTPGVGLDVEQLDREVTPEVVELVTRASERAWIGGDRARFLAVWSAKEAIFKATYPLAGVFLDFVDAELVDVRGALEDHAALTFALHVSPHPSLPVGARLELGVDVWTAHVRAVLVLPAFDVP